MSASFAMVVVVSGPLALQGTTRSNLPPISSHYLVAEYRKRLLLYNQPQVDAAKAQVESLRQELAATLISYKGP